MSIAAQPVSGADTARIERLAGLAKVWGSVKFLHPFPAYREIDWDQALIEAIPKVDAARSPNEYAEAINSMLAVLGDSQTRAFVPAEKEQAENKSNSKEPLRFENGILYSDVLAAARIASQNDQKSTEFRENFFKLLPQAKALVWDARTESETDEFILYLVGEQSRQILSAALDRKIRLGTLRYRMHNGYAPQDGSTSGGYYSALVTDTPQSFGADGAKPFKTPPIVIIVDQNPAVPEIFSGLQAAGIAFIVAETNDLGATSYVLKLADKVQVKIRLAEIVDPAGSIGLAPDVLAPKGEAEKTAQRIVAENKFTSTRSKTPAVPIGQVPQKDKPYAEMEFPTKEYRLLALFKFWNVINYFFPYKDLIGADWNEVLPKYIPKFEANKDAVEYQMTVRELSSETHDSHVGVRNANAANQQIGNFLPPLTVRFIENQSVVVKVLDDKLALRPGDVILTIDGEDAVKRREFFARITAASTPQSLMRSLHYSLLRGAKDSVVKLTVRGANGQVRTVEVPRSLNRTDPKFLAAEKRTTQVYTVLPSGFGYVDLDRLTVGEVDKMFDAVKNSPAVIFDMRGYPNGTAWSIAPRLSEKKQPVAALFSRPIVDGPGLANSDYSGNPQFTFTQPIPPRTGDVYRGKIVMLIDAYAISQSEHTALFFETARPDITFIGTPTTGANGDVTNLILPGNLIVSFSGHNVRHADGRQLQRVGIQPTVKAAPTVKGLAEGRDEILEAAIKFLQQNKK